MHNIKLWLLSCIAVSMFTVANAHINPNAEKNPESTSSSDATGISYRANCDNAVARVDMAINNVRARLTTGGDVWWDGDAGRYVVPKVEPGSGIDPVSSIYAGAIWLGGLDIGGTKKIAAQTYGRNEGKFDFWPGPLVPDGPDAGTVEQQTCSDWDRFFTVRATNINLHKALFEEAITSGVPYDESMIPEDVKGWPAKGNPFFFDIHEFDLPNTSQGLAGFHDYDDGTGGDGLYNPLDGDYPIIEIRDCPDLYYGDEMTFWIYNDAGNSHASSNAEDIIQMEIQVQAFAYSTSDEINNMTFQRYKLINRAIESLDSTYFAMWMDPDLGCHSDDYVGCDTTRSLAYVYNSDAVDGTTPGSCNCEQGTNSYCEEIPILGLDYFRGPLDENGNEIGMSSFTYYNRGGDGHPPGTVDPGTADEYYNYMKGLWRDGSPFQYGGDAYQEPGGEPIKYAFTEAPNDASGWSMYQESLPLGDRRTVQASGPFRLDPGAVNELIIGAVWVPNQTYPGPSIKKLQEADDIAQKLFDLCFEIPNGPDAPDVDFIELDQEFVMILTNNTNINISNNANEAYQETGLDIPAGILDSLYSFEGYRIFQVSGPGIDLSADNRNDPEKVRIVTEVNTKNGVSQLFNWKSLGEDESPIEGTFQAEPQLDSPDEDNGVKHTFRITEDQFAKGDSRLINHKKYYYIVVAYGYNNYEDFNPTGASGATGQRKPYFEGRRNIGPIGDGKPYTVIPRPITDRGLNAGYGDGAVITRIDGVGTGRNFLDLSDETRAAIEVNITDGTSADPELTYRAGRGPIDILVYNPLDVQNGEFELTFVDENLGNNELDSLVNWQLTNLTDPSAPVILSDRSIDKLNEQIVKEFGFSIAIGQVENVGSQAGVDPTNGYIGYEEEYTKGEEATKWLNGVPDALSDDSPQALQVLFDYVQNAAGQEYADDDPEQVFSKVGRGFFTPYYLCNFRGNEGQQEDVITPGWTNSSDTWPQIVHQSTKLSDLNNVDIVFTSDKSLWSRCFVVETANKWLNATEATVNDLESMDTKLSPSVTKFDTDGDGMPDIDTGETDKGFSWFPGYAVDVETGKRLNIFFGENSVYNGTKDPDSYEGTPTGDDMMFNPSSQFFLGTGGFPTPYNYMAGGHHFLYVTNEEYDACEELFKKMSKTAAQKIGALKTVTWAGFIMPSQGQEMLSYADGLIPEDVRVKLRVNDAYQVKEGTNDFNGYPTYRFKIDGLEANELDAEGIETALDLINVVPNPYYGFSDYENGQFDTNIKITNLPSKCVITIYSLDGKFIRQYNRDEIGANPNGYAINKAQVNPDVIWDLKNNKGIPVASGVYLIHIAAEGLGERTLKWFGVNRQFDPSGL